MERGIKFTTQTHTHKNRNIRVRKTVIEDCSRKTYVPSKENLTS